METMEIDNERRRKWLLAAKRCDSRIDLSRIRAAGKELDEFLKSDAGQDAVHCLLRATNQHVIFGKTNAMHPNQPCSAYLLRGGISGGLWMMVDKTSGGIFSSADYVASEEVKGEVVVEVAARCLYLQPEQVLPWLLGELDKIADSTL